MKHPSKVQNPGDEINLFFRQNGGADQNPYSEFLFTGSDMDWEQEANENNGDISCPHCGMKISGTESEIIANYLGEPDMMKWTVPCPNCGKGIKKWDVRKFDFPEHYFPSPRS
jgi:predicted RNA-binding Zn-ribbon protein involved in translation (DUF1610 family)